MLTEREKKWCKKRQKTNKAPIEEPWVLAPEFMLMAFREMHEAREAAEFSERVAVKLAINDTTYLPCHQKGHENQCPYNNYCPTDKKKTAWCKMKHARLQVEEEMDVECN